MMTGILIALAAGLASALMFASIVSGALISIALNPLTFSLSWSAHLGTLFDRRLLCEFRPLFARGIAPALCNAVLYSVYTMHCMLLSGVKLRLQYLREDGVVEGPRTANNTGSFKPRIIRRCEKPCAFPFQFLPPPACREGGGTIAPTPPPRMVFGGNHWRCPRRAGL